MSLLLVVSRRLMVPRLLVVAMWCGCWQFVADDVCVAQVVATPGSSPAETQRATPNAIKGESSPETTSSVTTSTDGVQILDGAMHHLRGGVDREWSSFPRSAEGDSLTLEFTTRSNATEQTLTLRQMDVRQRWEIVLNDKVLGRLTQDENDMFVDVAVPSKTLQEGLNRLTVRPAKLPEGTSDDIRVGEVTLHDLPLIERRGGHRVRVEVRDADSNEWLPCRVTVTDERGVLIPFGRFGAELQAHRTGVAYVGQGRAEIMLNPGRYRIFASRGFEYSASRSVVEVPALTAIELTGPTTELTGPKGLPATMERDGSLDKPSSRPPHVSLPNHGGGTEQPMSSTGTGPTTSVLPEAELDTDDDLNGSQAMRMDAAAQMDAADRMRMAATRMGAGAELAELRTDIAPDGVMVLVLPMSIRRIVPTGGWIACDTHVHTLTHSGHGDATIEERMLTLAGEGIELPIMTDHNQQIDCREISRAMGTQGRFTPIVGNEVTTKRGHFNIFPAPADGPLPDATLTDWNAIGDSITSIRGVDAIILNHARDIHSGFRPFSPRRHLSCSGEVEGIQDLKVNALEVLNSSALLNDPMALVHDWFGLMNAGHHWTPVGSSDGHDVSRFIIGQGRTYIRGNDANPGKLDTGDAIQAFREGKVVVSYGLFADIKVRHRDSTAGPGERVNFDPDQPRVADVYVSVFAPQWSRLETIELYLNGRLLRRQIISFEADVEQTSGEKRFVEWTLSEKELTHDGWLTVVARGPGITQPFWPTAKPYQATSPNWLPYTLSMTGPVYLDVDANGRYDSPRTQAEQLVKEAKGDLTELVETLRNADAAVAIQTLALLREQGTPPDSDMLQAAFTAAPRPVITRPMGVRAPLPNLLLHDSPRIAYHEYLADWKLWMKYQLEQTE
ncbi:MAG: CehA/McbA family metallohydrolase [Planctomycetaceae bacterium]